LTIDKGTESGIVTDMPVIAPGGPYGSLVGNVIESGRGFAKIRVLTDPAFSVGVTLPAHAGSNATNGIASGQVDSDLLLDNDVDAQKKVLPGDRIVTSPSAANLYPPDIPVGTVTKVQPQAGGLPQNVYIKPYVDLGALDYVAVMLWVQGGGKAVKTTTTTTTTTSPSSTTTTTVVIPGTGP
jgi:rod shape-determining protein MreC